MSFEVDIITGLQSVASASVTVLFKVISLAGSWYGFIVLFMLIFVFNKKLSYVFGGTFLTGVGFNYVLKHLIGRPRPYVTHSEILNLSNSMGLSMPSSHAFCATMLAVFVCYLVLSRTKNKLFRGLTVSLAAAVAILVCVSRMYLGVHYLTDLFVGVIIGLVFAFGGIMIYKRLNKREEHAI